MTVNDIGELSIRAVRRALKISALDNVAVLLSEVAAGEEVLVLGMGRPHTIIAQHAIPNGHKIAIDHVQKGAEVTGGGQKQGLAKVTITPGEFVHNHNVGYTNAA